jgi:hypothetical protein
VADQDKFAHAGLLHRFGRVMRQAPGECKAPSGQAEQGAQDGKKCRGGDADDRTDPDPQ